MTLLLSPAKTLDCNAMPQANSASQPDFLDDAAYLVSKLSKFSPRKLQSLMGISADLAQLNAERYSNWKTPFHPGNASPCIACFQGEVYRGLDAKSLLSPDLEFAQRNVRILSGLYGLLKPLDLMQPYRLEMGTKWAITQSKRNLYAFWGDRIALALNAEGESPVINLASKEYSKAVPSNALNRVMIDIEFKELVNGEWKIIGTYAKLARGLMARYAIKNRINHPEGLKTFDQSGYRYTESLSTESTWVFARDLQSLSN